MKRKICEVCKLELDISCFYKGKNRPDGYENKCKTCRSKHRIKFAHVCEKCGIEFKSIYEVQKYCSRKCKDESHIGQFQGEKSPRYSKITHKCDGCGKEHLVSKVIVEKQKRVFCSNECYKENCGKFKKGILVKNVAVICYVCGKMCFKKPHQVKEGKKIFCSHQCYLSIIGQLHSQKYAHTRIEQKCAFCGKLVNFTRSSKKHYKHVYCSKECQNKGYSLLYTGENNHGWDPLRKYEERLKERSIIDYKQWRSYVYERDNYTCQCCSDNKGGNLVAHHLESYTANKKLRFDVDNGITLCKTCHLNFHKSYGYKNNTKQQFNEWMNNKVRTVN